MIAAHKSKITDWFSVVILFLLTGLRVFHVHTNEIGLDVCCHDHGGSSSNGCLGEPVLEAEASFYASDCANGAATQCQVCQMLRGLTSTVLPSDIAAVFSSFQKSFFLLSLTIFKCDLSWPPLRAPPSDPG